MEDVVDDSKQRTKDKDKEKERRSSSHRDSRRSDKDREKEHKERESKDHKERESKDHRRDKDSRHKDREKDHKSSRHRNNDHRDREKDHKSSRDLIDEKSRGRTRDDRHDRDRDRDRKKREEKSRKHENEKRDVSDSDDELQRRRRKREREHRSDSDDAREQRKSRRKESTSRRERHSDEDEDERGRRRDKERDDDDERSRRRHKDRERGHRDEVVEENSRRKSEDSDEEAREKRKKDDMEAEQKRLDEEMEKRRRRVQEWQEMRRKKNDNGGNEAKEGKTWTLDAEDSDEDSEMPEEKKTEEEENNGNGYENALENGNAPMDVDKNGTADDDEIDPLDAFMNSLVVPEATPQENMTKKDVAKDDNKNIPKSKVGRIRQGEDSDYESDVGDDEDKNLEDEDDEEFMKRVKKSKVEKLSIVDHSKVQYIPFRKDFYHEVKEISLMSVDDVALYRKQLELKIRGKSVPKPIKTWNQTGLTRNVLDVLKKAGFEKPMSIQAQALPAIMSGRDCIGVAKTGSGKTLAFVLPMLRHIKDQPPLASGDGPIGLVMAPTRELVQQIHSDIKKFTKVMGLTCVPVYGGSGVAQQISELKRGTEIVVCTPGRMIDILCTSGGKITNLRRVTYLVMDEADRMFDMGFEPQITRIVQNTRPDRQTVLFSATFPRQVETLARKVLNKPVEIQVGGRSVVNKDITQIIEVRPESDRFLRLLELLGQWYEKGKMLVFVHSQEKCDNLFKDLLRHGYPCLSLHGAKDQTDRESTISDFKSNVCNLLIATSVAARGLDVKELELVVNFDAPNHYEDYVHRVGRTGRAGRKGCAVTFISPDEERYAPDLVKALELSEQPIPEDLKQLADAFMAKVNQGTEHAHGTGYGGSGFKFNEEEEEARRAAKKAQAREYGYEEYDKSDSEDEDESVRKGGNDLAQAQAIAQAAAMAAAASANRSNVPTSTTGVSNPISLPNSTVAVVSNDMTSDPATRAATIVAALNLQHNLAKIQKDAMPEHYEAELEINDFPQNARWKVTHKETLGPISEWTGAAITTRGQYYPPGKIPGPGERKLYLFIEGPTESSVKKAKAEVKRVLEDYTAQALNVPGGVQPGKYSVI